MVATADFNTDGYIDLVVTSVDALAPGAPQISFGLGGGRVTPAVDVGLPSFPQAGHFRIANGDLNLDGAMDLVLQDWWSDSLNILLGRGNGTFETASDVYQSIPSFARPTVSTNQAVEVNGPFIVDINFDGNPDLLHQVGDSIFGWLGKGNGDLC